MDCSRGFSLIELMVAMVVSLVVILGAGQLFISLSQTSQRVSLLSEKQAAVNFAVETLLRDIRRADWSYYNDSDRPDRHPNIPWDESEGVLSLYVPNRGDVSSSSDVCDPGDMVLKNYRLVEREVAGESTWFMAVEAAECELGGQAGDWRELSGGTQELVGGFAEVGFGAPPFDASGGNEIGVLVTLRLQPLREGGDPDELVFHAVNRQRAIE